MEYFIGLIFVGVIVGLILRKHKPELFEYILSRFK